MISRLSIRSKNTDCQKECTKALKSIQAVMNGIEAWRKTFFSMRSIPSATDRNFKIRDERHVYLYVPKRLGIFDVFQINIRMGTVKNKFKNVCKTFKALQVSTVYQKMQVILPLLGLNNNQNFDCKNINITDIVLMYNVRHPKFLSTTAKRTKVLEKQNFWVVVNCFALPTNQNLLSGRFVFNINDDGSKYK